MSSSRDDRCGYVWTGGTTGGGATQPPHCCYRETVDGADACVWHMDERRDEKTAEALQDDIERTREVGDDQILLDGANLRGLDLADAVSFESVSLRDADLTDANLSEANLRDCDLRGATLTGANLSDTDLTDAVLSRADLTNARLSRATLVDAALIRADLSDASLLEADLSSAYLFGGTTLAGANLAGATFVDAGLSEADLTKATAGEADFTDASLSGADLTDASLIGATLTGANLENALLVRSNLFDATLANCKLHGATLTDAQINDATTVAVEHNRERRWWHRGPFETRPRCAYDPENDSANVDGAVLENLGKAADVYQSLERLARENAQPSMESSMFLLRQDMQRKRFWRQEDYLDWSFARVSRALFKHGESFGRVLVWSSIFIGAFAVVYLAGGWIHPVEPSGGLGRPVSWTRLPGDVAVIWESIYYSTLAFTALGFGDFRPVGTMGQVFTIFETALGALLLALLVFVFGRRAAR